MHMVTDENGNICAHAHSHTHSHTHEGGLEHSHPHSHEHGHENEHSHTHSHADGCSQESCGECQGCGQEQKASDKNAALLTYMYQHNQSHAAELDQMAEKLLQEGNDKAAEQIRKAVDEFQKGNMYLNLALAMVKDGQ